MASRSLSTNNDGGGYPHDHDLENGPDDPSQRRVLRCPVLEMPAHLVTYGDDSVVDSRSSGSTNVDSLGHVSTDLQRRLYLHTFYPNITPTPAFVIIVVLTTPN